MLRYTKIISTIGPATCDPAKMRALLTAGANCFRFNIKHNTAAWHQSTIDSAKQIAAELNKHLTIIVDTPKPELALAIKGMDYVALSYITTAEDITLFRNHLTGADPPKIIGKIENKTALINLESIIDTADAVMIARGDLAKDIPFEHLAFWQKKIIDSCRLKFKPVVVATEMLESMVKNPTPTRAEACDVANAVYDGTDCIMLSGETATGAYPVEAVKIMDSIASFCDNQAQVKSLELPASTPSDLLIKSASYIITKSPNIKAAVIFSQTGSSVKKLSAYRLPVPIIAITNNQELLDVLNLSRAAIPYYSQLSTGDFEIKDKIFDDLLELPFLSKGDMVLVIHGTNWFASGSTSDISLKTL